MTALRLADLRRCFQGVIPSLIATASADGTPNVTWLSQVYFVDERHVALSFQFFNKTKKNVLENPRATVQLYDPVSLEAFELDLRFDRSESEGPLFDAMSARIQAIASQTGMAGVFRLRSADVYEVLALQRVEGFASLPTEPELAAMVEEAPPAAGEMRTLQMLSGHLARATDLESLLSALLTTLERELGFRHAMVLLLDERGEKLFTVASRGYGESGVGSEVALGDGLIGTAAERKRTLRFSDLDGDLRYARAVRHASREAGAPTRPEIPLPGLPDAQSHLAIPLVSHDRLVGVLAVESESTLGFDEGHEEFLDIVGNQAAVAIENLWLRAEHLETSIEPSPAKPTSPGPPKSVREVVFYANDDCVFVDGEYLVRNVPGRILWKLLRSHADTGRADFTNRELRLDPSLKLPPIKDNLESRLILLRRRLEQKCPSVRLVPTRRGRFALEVGGPIALVEKVSA
jgi:putative methionine-R-sulfoxide reductase with GAF domain/predicted pyridoxine 5'-phosphate oxidase superfamily flavin-nucleotide-binding protein